MRHLKYLVLLAALALPAAYSQAQVAVGVQIGPSYGVYNAPPVCEYGFYPDYPFACAPHGYWGPEYFVDGIFIGAGPLYNFYYTHPGFYRPFYVNRGFGFHGGFNHFRGGGRIYDRERFRGDGFRDRGFRNFNGVRGGQSFRGDAGRSFRGDAGRSFRGEAGRGFRSDGNRGSRSGGGGREFRGGNGVSRGDGGRGVRSGGNGGGSHGGRASHGGGDSRGGGRGDHGGRR